MTAVVVRQHADADGFLAAAEPWLLQREAAHNLILGIVGSLRQSSGGYGHPIYLATVEAHGSVAGCAFRTPPFKVGVTELPEGSGDALARDLACVYEEIPAVLGPPPAARAVGAAWSRLKGVAAREGMAQRIYALDSVTMPSTMPRGFMRPATVEDLGLIMDWLARFMAETALMGAAPDRLAAGLIDAGALALWEDGGPVSMAGFSGSTPNTVRVSYVFTPEERRGSGYASALVAHLSRYLLDTRCRQCVLYTDLGNPTSNGIYQRIGYRPVSDALDVVFTHVAKD